MASVLIVDDAAETRLLVRTLLAHAGYAVIEASDGRNGLEQAAAHRPDLILLDLSLPSMSGPEFIRTLRADPQTKTIAVALYTATPQDRAMRDFMEMYQIRHAIPKPSEPSELIEAVQRALS
jgi:CheY-like chemotaxis protein